MQTRKSFAGVMFLLAFATQGLMASVAVGNCKPGLTSFTTIQAAVTAAPAGATIWVCPGHYPEQIVISQPLTLQGVANTGAAVVIPPATGIVANSVLGLGGQIVVQDTAAVTIRNLTVDGTNNGIVPCAVVLVGILFENASGLVDQVATRHQTIPANAACDGRGIEVRTDSGLTSTVAVQNSTVHDFQFEGIRSLGRGTTTTIKATTVSGVPFSQTSTNNIDFTEGATGSVNGSWIVDAIWAPLTYPNFNSGAWGILLNCASGVSITANTISNTQSGIVLLSQGCNSATWPNSDNNNLSSNFIMGSHLFEGIYVCGNNNTVQNNVINSSDESAVDIDSCNSGGSGNNNTVAANKINEACAAVLLNPAATGNTIGSNRLANVNFAQVSGVIGANVCDAPGDPQDLVKLTPQN
jgi:hypothetical protein